MTWHRAGVVLLAGLATGGFTPADSSERGADACRDVGVCAAPPLQPAKRLAVVDGLAQPEAVVYDPAVDAYFVSDVNGTPGVKDGNGFISRIRGDGKLDSLHFIQSGRNGVTLNAPMGSRIHGDTLWVLDVDVLRGFDVRSGAPLAVIDLAPMGALFLNDFTFGPEGHIYVTDMRLRVTPDGKLTPTGPGRLYRIGRDRSVTVALESAALDSPDGIGWDPGAKRFIIAPFKAPATVQAWRVGEKEPRSVAEGKGRFDGVEVERDGSILITAWNDSSVSTLERNRLARRLGPLSMTLADVTLDERRRQVGVVSLEANRFELWTWPK